ncbi:DMT family transporter [Sphingobacterium sp. SRCM116780]|uniref:EamA family transporter n=1 Tax=Sphingobacterium sp. SRCM116780 TaxID=2907623 RepID=UPI001F40C18C|nr:DMT family transporter [Sphingobacterium sp. SRCM116780]UIR56509.1 DMT family transporter [Sphingobacterium sp. SRCM116780]
MEKLKGAIAVFVGASSFGVLSTFVKQAYAQDYYTLGQVTGVQVIFGMIILWMVYWLIQLLNPTANQSYTKKSNKWKILISGISTGLVSIIYYKCVQLVPASLAIVLLMQYIWIGTLIEFIVFKNKPSSRQLIGIVIVLIGTLLATDLIEQGIDKLNWTGIAYGLLAATAYASFLIVNGRIGNDYPPIQKSALMVTGSCIMICCIFPPTFLISGVLGNSIWHFGFILSLFGTVIPPLLFAYGIPKIGYSLSGILSSAELPVAICMSYFILREVVNPIQWTGVLLILATVVWLNTKSQETSL